VFGPAFGLTQPCGETEARKSRA